MEVRFNEGAMTVKESGPSGGETGWSFTFHANPGEDLRPLARDRVRW